MRTARQRGSSRSGRGTFALTTELGNLRTDPAATQLGDRHLPPGGFVTQDFPVGDRQKDRDLFANFSGPGGHGRLRSSGGSGSGSRRSISMRDVVATSASFTTIRFMFCKVLITIRHPATHCDSGDLSGIVSVCGGAARLHEADPRYPDRRSPSDRVSVPEVWDRPHPRQSVLRAPCVNPVSPDGFGRGGSAGGTTSRMCPRREQPFR